jgi:hypothetical protein
VDVQRARVVVMMDLGRGLDDKWLVCHLDLGWEDPQERRGKRCSCNGNLGLGTLVSVFVVPFLL